MDDVPGEKKTSCLFVETQKLFNLIRVGLVDLDG